VKIQPVEMSIQPVVLHLMDFEKGFKKLDFVVKQIQSIVSKIQPIDLLKTLTKFC